eukprot:g65226.t1
MTNACMGDDDRDSSGAQLDKTSVAGDSGCRSGAPAHRLWISLRSKNCLIIEPEDESRVRRDVGVWKNQLSSSCRPRASREVIGHARGVAR